MADHKVRGKHLRAAIAAVCGVVLFGLGCETPSPFEVEEPDAYVQAQEFSATEFMNVFVYVQPQESSATEFMNKFIDVRLVGVPFQRDSEDGDSEAER